MSIENCRNKIISQNYWDFIIPAYRQGEEFALPEDRACLLEMDGGYRCVYMDRELLQTLSFDQYGYNSIPKCYALQDMQALEETGIRAIQRYPGLELMGEGVMIGFVDTGIDYEADIFRNIDGSTRIAGIWDQTIQTGMPPLGLDYGSAYSREEIDEALRSEEPKAIVPSEDLDSHGTFLASIAAGGGNIENQFLGAAPEAVIGVVKLKEAKDYLRKFYQIRDEATCYQENDIMLGLKYLNDLARENDLPLILCLSLGTNMGGHEGRAPLPELMNVYARQSKRAVVAGGGNEANQRHHYRNILTRDGMQEVELRVGEQVSGFAVELWTTIPNVVTTYLVSPSGERSSPISLRQGSSYRYEFLFDRTMVDVEYRLLIENNDSVLLFFRFRTPAAGIWKIGVEPIYISDGIYHMWLPVEEFVGGEVYFLEASPDVTLTEPGNAIEIMTVSYYNGESQGIDINSGRGYTRSGFIKPDFAAPGVNVTGMAPGGRFTSRSGASIGTALATGASALVMEWLLKQPEASGLTSSQVRNILILGTQQKVLEEFPNPQWGYGWIDLFTSFDRLRQL